MKKLITLILIFMLFPISSLTMADEWDDIPDIDRSWDGQKPITNQEFEQVMDALQAKTKKKEAKQRKKLIKKISGGGTSLHEELNPDKNIQELQSLKTTDEELLINLPVKIIADGKILDKGFYNVTAYKDENKNIYLNLYQAHYLMAKIEANETDNDFEEKEVNFARVINYNDSFIKLIYGSIDFNAYAYIPFVNE